MKSRKPNKSNNTLYFLISVQVNATGYNEKVVRVEVPEREDAAEGPQPVLVNVRMEPTRTSDNIVSTEHYTYWMLDGDRVNGETETKTTIVVHEPPIMEPEEKDHRNREYIVVTNDQDDVDLQLMQPPMPVSSFSSATAVPTIVSSDNRFRNRVTKMVTLFLGTYYVSVYSRR